MAEKEFRKSAVLSSDLAGLSKALEDHSTEALDLLLWQRDTTTRICRANGGRLISTSGESCLFDFPAVSDAALSALEMYEEFFSQKASHPTFSCGLRVGIDFGAVHFLEDSAFGEAVETANLLRMNSSPNSIRISERANEALPQEIVAEAKKKGILKVGKGASTAEGPEHAPSKPANPPRRRAGDSPDNRGAPDSTLSSIREAILADTKARGVRMSVGEAKTKYGYYGPEALEVIASLADSGILVRGPAGPRAEERVEASPYRGADLGKSIETAVHAIVSEIERAVGENIKNEAMRGRTTLDFGRHWEHADFDRAAWKNSREERRSARHEFREEFRRARDSYRHSDRKDRTVGALGAYRDGLTAKAKKLRHSLIGNIISYSVVNSVFWSLNARYAHQVPWALPVSVFWGIGVLDNIVSAVRLTRQSREAEALPELDEAQLSEYKALNKRRDGLGKHLISALSISAVLFAINIFTGAATLWFAFPSAVLLVSFVADAIGYAATFPSKRKKFFASLGIKGGRQRLYKEKAEEVSEAAALGAYADLYRTARSISRELERDFQAADSESVAEIHPELESYLGQVKLLSQTANELDSIIGAIPMNSLKADKEKLVKKASAAPSELLSEYASSIAEIEKQEESFKALQEQREVIDLRLKSSVNKLRQLQLDLAKARASSVDDAGSQGGAALDAVKSRTEELSKYIEDLKAGRLETLEDPFAELERAESLKKKAKGIE